MTKIFVSKVRVDRNNYTHTRKIVRFEIDLRQKINRHSWKKVKEQKIFFSRTVCARACMFFVKLKFLIPEHTQTDRHNTHNVIYYASNFYFVKKKCLQQNAPNFVSLSRGYCIKKEGRTEKQTFTLLAPVQHTRSLAFIEYFRAFVRSASTVA